MFVRLMAAYIVKFSTLCGTETYKSEVVCHASQNASFSLLGC
jgi:hypothetical protein